MRFFLLILGSGTNLVKHKQKLGMDRAEMFPLAVCDEMKANTSLIELKCRMILPLSFVELFFSAIPSQLKRISTIVIFLTL